MYGGDRARKTNLVDYGFRLQAAIDNRPLKFEEFESMFRQCIYVSATPADYEIEKSEGILIEQVIRPTGFGSSNRSKTKLKPNRCLNYGNSKPNSKKGTNTRNDIDKKDG